MREYYEKFIYRYKNLESSLSKEKSLKSIFFILSVIFFGLILLLNLIYPLYADDWIYTFIWGTKLTQKTTGFTDILVSQYHHYFQQGGRTVVHIIAQSLLLTKGYWTDLINSIAYIAFAYLTYKICNINKKINPSLFFFINILIWFFQPGFAQSVLWITGSANYLWGTLIIMLFIYFFCIAFLKEKYENSFYKAIIFFFCGIIAGWTSENTALGMILIISLLLVYLNYQKTKIPNWMIMGLIGAIIGYIIMILAPGNFIRYESSLANNQVIHESKFEFYISRLYPVIGDFLTHALSLVVIYAILLVIYLSSQNERNWKVVFLSLFFGLAGIFSDFVMVASPEFPPRAWFGIITFWIVAIGIIYANIQINSITSLSGIRTILILTSCIYFIPSYYQGFKDIYSINKILENRERIINRQENKADFDFVAKDFIYSKTEFPMIYEMSTDSTFWVNEAYQRYHNIKSFKVELSTE